MPITAIALIIGVAAGPANLPEIATTTIAESVAVLQAEAQEPQRPAPAGSDAPAEEKKPPTPPHTGIRALFVGLGEDFTHLPSRPNAYLALLGGGLALGAHQVDTSFNVRLRSHYTLVNSAFAPAKYLGDTPVQAALSIGTYFYGRAFGKSKASHLGMDLLRAQMLTEALVQSLKFATRRERPDGSNSYSFPSGHAAVTFAGATVLERHLGWKQSALAYAAATYIAASRLHDNRHYLSDVAFGAAIGAIAGRTVTQHGRESWTLLPVSVPGGIAIMALHTPTD